MKAHTKAALDLVAATHIECAAWFRRLAELYETASMIRAGEVAAAGVVGDEARKIMATIDYAERAQHATMSMTGDDPYWKDFTVELNALRAQKRAAPPMPVPTDALTAGRSTNTAIEIMLGNLTNTGKAT